MCGFTDVIKVDGKYQCAKCKKIMRPEWEHEVQASRLRLPKTRPATREEKISKPGVYEVKE